MKRIALIVVAALAVLVGCAGSADAEPEKCGWPSHPCVNDQRRAVTDSNITSAGFTVVKIKVDGRDITCIAWSEYSSYGGAGLSCDWNPK